MHQIQFIYIEPHLPIDLILNTLNRKSEFKVLYVGDIVRNQLDKNDDLTLQIRECLDFGKIILPNLITELISLNIKELEYPNILMFGYPKTIEQYQDTSKMLLENNYVIEKFWYFEHRDSLQYFHKFYDEPNQKPYLDKYGDDIKQAWFTNIDNYNQSVNELYSLTNHIKWKRIKVSYTDKIQGLMRFQGIIDEHLD